MALDEAIAETVIKGIVPTTLRFYEWNTKTLSLGAFQRIQDVDVTYCIENQIPIVRRPTGGRAILHCNELTYSISSINTDKFSRDIKNTYLLISSVFVDALISLGIDVEFSDRRAKGSELTRSPLCFNAVSIGEITYKDKKLIGSAQKRWINGFLQQGSIPFEVDYKTMNKVFYGINVFQFTDMKTINPDIKIGNLKEKIIKGMERYFQVSLCLSAPLEIERQRALELIELKYQTHQWTYQRGGNDDRKRDETLKL